MTKDEIIRAFLHLPVGLLNAWFFSFNEMLGLGMVITFLCYEAMNDWRKKDWSYKDIFGYAFGLGLGGVAIYFTSPHHLLIPI